MNDLEREKLYALVLACGGAYGKIRRMKESGREIPPVSVPAGVILIGDADYPGELLSLEEPPFALFTRGDKSLLQKRKISIVGSRMVSSYGIRACRSISCRLSSMGFVIVSGMARGTDRTAQIHARRTIGVLAGGTDVVYPAENADLYEKVRREGLLISEYPDGIRPRKESFPFRNRIIAALGEKLVVPAARVCGGTMTTVQAALRLSRPIYTIPYPLDDPSGQGCNRLIEEGASLLLEKGDLEEFRLTSVQFPYN